MRIYKKKYKVRRKPRQERIDRDNVEYVPLNIEKRKSFRFSKDISKEWGREWQKVVGKVPG